MIDIQMPKRLDVELQVLGALFNYPEEIAAANVTDRCFTEFKYKRAFEVIKARGQDRTALAGILSFEDQQELENVWSSANLPAQAAELYAIADARDSLKTLRDCIEAFDLSDPAAFRETLSDAMMKVSSTLASSNGLELKSTNDAAAIMAEYVKNCSSIAVGIDHRLGLRPGQVLLVGARPGTGKTALLGQVLANVAANEPGDPLLYSLEMEAGELFHRLACHAAGRFVTPESDDGMYWAGQLPTFLGGKEILVCDEPSRTMMQIETSAAAICAQRKVSVIGIDYASLIENSSKEKRHEAMADVSRRLKQMARRLRVPVVCLVQLTKEANGRPTLSSLAESDGFARDANQVWALWLDKQEDEELDPTPTNLTILKNRGGFTGNLELDFHKRSMAFRKRAI